MTATSFTAESFAAPVPNADDLGGLSMLQVSIVVSLEVARLLTASADTELAEGASACGFRAWSLFRDTGRLLASYARAAKRVGRMLSELLADADHPAPAVLSHIKDLLRDMDREAEGVQREYVSLGHDARNLFWQAATKTQEITLGDGRTQLLGPDPRHFQDMLQLRKAMPEGDTSKVLAFLLAPTHSTTSVSNAAADPSAAAMAAETSQPNAAELCALIAQRAASAAGAGEEARAHVISELRQVDDSLISCQAFWEDMRLTLRSLALTEEHLELMAPSAARNDKLRERYEARLGDYSKAWSSLLKRTASAELSTPPISPRSAGAGM